MEGWAAADRIFIGCRWVFIQLHSCTDIDAAVRAAGTLLALKLLLQALNLQFLLM